MTTKKIFTGFTKIARCENPTDDCHYFTFKLWKKNNITRIYISDYKERIIGYIEDKEFKLKDKQGNYQADIDFAINTFLQNYMW